MEDVAEAVVLTDERGRILLRPTGPAGLGWPIRLDASSGPFSVSVQSEARNLSAFLTALRGVHHTLGGSARLIFWDADHEVVLAGDGKGKVLISARITDGTPWSACLSIRMNLDQSYLPRIIRSLAAIA